MRFYFVTQRWTRSWQEIFVGLLLMFSFFSCIYRIYLTSCQILINVVVVNVHVMSEYRPTLYLYIERLKLFFKKETGGWTNWLWGECQKFVFDCRIWNINWVHFQPTTTWCSFLESAEMAKFEYSKWLLKMVFCIQFYNPFIFIVNPKIEELTLADHKNSKGTWDKDFDSCVLPLVQEQQPCYLMYRWEICLKKIW